MKKRTIWTYGTVVLPLDVGKRAHYLQNGVMRATEIVQRILEQAEDYIKFETERFCYCIEYHKAEENVMDLAAQKDREYPDFTDAPCKNDIPVFENCQEGEGDKRLKQAGTYDSNMLQ